MNWSLSDYGKVLISIGSLIGVGLFGYKIYNEKVNSQPQCESSYRLSDPNVIAIFFIGDLLDKGMVDRNQPMNFQGADWLIKDGDLIFIMGLNGTTYIAHVCFTVDSIEFYDVAPLKKVENIPPSTEESFVQ